MKKSTKANISYDDIAQDYDITHRISESCINSLIQSIVTGIQDDIPKIIVDLGCGDGYFSSRLLSKQQSSRYILLDVSRAMLNRAVQHISTIHSLHRSLFILADANTIPLYTNSVNVVLMSFLLHLIPDHNHVLEEVKRILTPGGKLFLVTYDPEDLSHDIYDEYIPGFREVNLPRFVPLPELFRILKTSGFSNIYLSKHPYGITFQNIEEVISVVKKKPFSALKLYPNDDFAEGLEAFKSALQREFGQDEITYSSKASLISMET